VLSKTLFILPPVADRRGCLLALMAALSLMSGAFGLSWDVFLLRSTKDVEAGSKFGQAKEEVSLTAAHNFANSTLFCNANGRLMEGALGCNRLSTRVGYQTFIMGLCQLGVDCQANFYFRSEVCSEDREQDNDVHGTIRVGDDFSLGCDAIYNFNRRDINAWLSTSRLGSLSPIGLNSLYLRSFLSFGYDRCLRPDGEINFFRDTKSEKPHWFFYYGWGGDLILQHGTAPAFSILGVRCAGNFASKTNWNNRDRQHRHSLWMVTGVRFQF
jgi:hypothetical protein